MSTESDSMVCNWVDEYEKTLRKQVEFTPNNPVALYSLGRLLRLSNRPEEAEEYLKKAIEVDSHLGAWVELFLLYHKEGLINDRDSVQKTIVERFGLRMSQTGVS